MGTTGSPSRGSFVTRRLTEAVSVCFECRIKDSSDSRVRLFGNECRGAQHQGVSLIRVDRVIRCFRMTGINNINSDLHLTMFRLV